MSYGPNDSNHSMIFFLKPPLPSKPMPLYGAVFLEIANFERVITVEMQDWFILLFFRIPELIVAVSTK